MSFGKASGGGFWPPVCGEQTVKLIIKRQLFCLHIIHRKIAALSTKIIADIDIAIVK